MSAINEARMLQAVANAEEGGEGGGGPGAASTASGGPSGPDGADGDARAAAVAEQPLLPKTEAPGKRLSAWYRTAAATEAIKGNGASGSDQGSPIAVFRSDSGRAADEVVPFSGDFDGADGGATATGGGGDVYSAASTLASAAARQPFVPWNGGGGGGADDLDLVRRLAGVEAAQGRLAAEVAALRGDVARVTEWLERLVEHRRGSEELGGPSIVAGRSGA